MDYHRPRSSTDDLAMNNSDHRPRLRSASRWWSSTRSNNSDHRHRLCSMSWLSSTRSNNSDRRHRLRSNSWWSSTRSSCKFDSSEFRTSASTGDANSDIVSLSELSLSSRSSVSSSKQQEAEYFKYYLQRVNRAKKLHKMLGLLRQVFHCWFLMIDCDVSHSPPRSVTSDDVRGRIMYLDRNGLRSESSSRRLGGVGLDFIYADNVSIS